jgi:hypothetical protein
MADDNATPDRVLRLAQALADAYGPVGAVDQMPLMERETFIDMALAALQFIEEDDA